MREEKSISNKGRIETGEVSSLSNESSLNSDEKPNSSDWRSKFFEMDLLSPVYIFLFIVLFKNGKDGADLHDAIINFVMTYNN